MANNFANVEPDALRKMNTQIHELSSRLDRTKGEMRMACDACYQQGNRDIQFEKIRQKINDSENKLQELKGLMVRYTDYLEKQEKTIRQYLSINGPK
jgi:hypothetical protein